MKIKSTREDLLSALQPVIGVIDKRQTMPILGNVLLKAQSESLYATGTDLETQISSSVSTEVIDDGSITVSARKLFDIIKALAPESSVTMSLNSKEKLIISSGKGRYQLSTIPADDYPEFQSNEFDYSITLNSKLLLSGFDKVNFCMANQDVRYYLNGIMLSINEKGIDFVSSDGHRMALLSIASESTYECQQSQIIIPRKAAIELHKLMGSIGDCEVKVNFSRNAFSVDLGGVVFSTKLIDSKYPSFDRAIEQPTLPVITVNKDSLKQAISRAMILANEKFRGIEFSIDGSELEILTSNPEHEEASDVVDIEYSGQPVLIGFNAQYMLEAINKIDNDNVLIEIAENSSVIKVLDPNDMNYNLVIMPMRL